MRVMAKPVAADADAEFYDKGTAPTTASGLTSGLPTDAVDAIKEGEVSMLINIPEGTTRSEEITAGYRMRRAAVDYGVSLLTNVKCATLFADALARNRTLPYKSVEEYLSSLPPP